LGSLLELLIVLDNLANQFVLVGSLFLQQFDIIHLQFLCFRFSKDLAIVCFLWFCLFLRVVRLYLLRLDSFQLTVGYLECCSERMLQQFVQVNNDLPPLELSDLGLALPVIANSEETLLSSIVNH
jgi:hypothetical protein